MRTLRTLFAATLGCALSACVYVPVVDEHQSDASCKTLTQSLSLDKIEMQSNVSYGCREGECLAAMLAGAAVVTTGSAIISGSIVLTGNTIHWLEYQGTCSDGYLSKAKHLFLDSLGKLKPAPANEAQKNK